MAARDADNGKDYDGSEEAQRVVFRAVLDARSNPTAGSATGDIFRNLAGFSGL
jgi:hypothetical protein